jgi:hypothetical protein
MKKRILTPKKDNVRREQDPIPWRYCLLTLVCGLLLVTGFFWAARQHFSAMDFGIKNAKLRQQKESLEAEQRRLSLSREISLSPSEIKKIAKKIGLQDLTAESIEVISAAKNTVFPANETMKQPLVAKTAKVEKSIPEKSEENRADTTNKVSKSGQLIVATTDLRERIAKK